MTRWKWIKQSSYWILGASTVALIANVIHARQVTGLEISTNASNWVVFLAFAFAIAMGFWAFVTRLQAIDDETVEQSQKEATDALVKDF